MLQKCKDIFHRITGRLSSRLLLTVCVTFLPLNFAMILLSGVLVYNASAEVMNAWQREIQSSVSELDQKLSYLEGDMEDFVTEYLYELTVDGTDYVEMVQMLDDLGGIFSGTDLPGFIYLQDRSTNLVYFKYDTNNYTLEQLNHVRKGLPKHDVPFQGKWELLPLADQYYFAHFYEYTNYRVGICVAVDAAFAHIHSSGSRGDDAMYLQTQQYTLLRDNGSFCSFSGDADGTGIYTVFDESMQSGLRIRVQVGFQRLLGMIPALCWMLVILSLACGGLIVVIWKSLQNQVVKPLQALQYGMEQLQLHHMDYRLDGAEELATEDLRYLYDGFNRMAQEVGDSYEKDIKMVQTELDNLRLQVNPHMLLNSYNMIYSLAQSKNYQCIQEYTLHLADYFRYVLRENNDFVTLEREMNFVSSYIAIQNIRFPGAFDCSVEVTREARKALVPPLLVENFVENAMKYAMIPGKKIQIGLKASRQEDRLIVTITDNGQGIKPEILEYVTRGEVYVDKLGHKHIGIYNCRRRMELFYRGNGSLQVHSIYGNGTGIRLDLPYWLTQEHIERRKQP